MTTKLFPVASFLVEREGANVGQFIGVNPGRGLNVTDQGPMVGLEAEVEGYPTIHFRCGQMTAGNLNLAAPGVPAANSMAFFGQLNIRYPMTIAAIHLHLIENAGAGSLGIEVYRRRAGAFTLLATLTAVPADGDFATVAAVPAGDLALLQAGDYLFCQPIAKDLVAAGANGATVDIHFLPTPAST